MMEPAANRTRDWIYPAATLFAAAVLGAASVWMGGLNQDEGWYLYAANMVGEGRMPYRDFFYTQGPVMPLVYSAFTWVWKSWGMLGARIFTLLAGFVGIGFAAALARRLAPAGRGRAAALTVLMLVGCNIYHLYFVTIPKTYALAALFVSVGFYLMSFGGNAAGRLQKAAWSGAGLSLAFAAGTRISLGALLAVAGLWLVSARRWKALVFFSIGGFAGLVFSYLPFLIDGESLKGLCAAQRYHASRGGFDAVWCVGSLSRLVRWYTPLFVIGGLGVFMRPAAADRGDTGETSRSVLSIAVWGIAAVFTVQVLAPFPYEDYQVPIMGLAAAAAAAVYARRGDPDASDGALLLPVLGMTFACSFGSPLLEKWTTNGQDRFWTLKKEKTEMAQLRDVAKRIERLDPGGRTLLTQDVYLAIETGRSVPRGLEMGPFSMLTDGEWRRLLTETAPRECAVAALSGYAFAVEPPECTERPVDRQMEYWHLLKKNFRLADREESFGQNATTLLILKRK